VRPVNLIPADERRGDRAPMRTGIFSYVLIGGLAAAVLAVAVLALTSKQISDRKSEVAQLQQQEQEANAKAQSLAAFIQFRAAQDARSGTIASLAQSRFDWQRVMNEFARVIPSDVWFIKVAGSVDPGVTVTDGPDLQTRASVPGPALELLGCAPSQDAVAGLIANLQEIDGVTRVGLEASERPDVDQGAATASPTTTDSNATTTDCRTRNFITQFKIVVAFDQVPTPATATSTPGVPPGVPTPGAGGSQLASQSTPSSASGG
jgi:Tfp pilus assembly protein PilN